MTAKNYPKDLSTTLDSVSYQAERLTRVGDSQMNESILEKSVDLLTSILNYYTTCLKVFGRGLLGFLSICVQLIP